MEYSAYISDSKESIEENKENYINEQLGKNIQPLKNENDGEINYETVKMNSIDIRNSWRSFNLENDMKDPSPFTETDFLKMADSNFKIFDSSNLSKSFSAKVDLNEPACDDSPITKLKNELNNLASNIEALCRTCDPHKLNETLRTVILTLKEFAVDLTSLFIIEASSSNFIDRFFSLLEESYFSLVEKFEEQRASYKPLIKVLQVFDIILENLNSKGDEKLKHDLILRMHKLLEEKYEKMTDWRLIRKRLEQEIPILTANSLKDQLAPLKEILLRGFVKEMEKIKKILVWKPRKKSIIFVDNIIDTLFEFENKNRDEFIQCLIAGRFHKNTLNKFSHNKEKISGSLVLGDEGGLYALFNSVVPGSVEEAITFENGVSMEYLQSKRDSKAKVFLGSGSFGVVRSALSVFGDLNVEIGQFVCVKKIWASPKTITKNNPPPPTSEIVDSLFREYLSKKINDSIYSPKVLDMAISFSRLTHSKLSKGYVMMEIIPENTAKAVLKDPKYQRWDFIKHYIIEVIKAMSKLLVKDGIFNSDLKPENTLFDPFSRKMAMIDLSNPIYIDRSQDIRNNIIKQDQFDFSNKYFPPEIDIDNTDPIDFLKANSYICGKTIEEIVEPLLIDGPFTHQPKNLAESSELDSDSRKKLRDIVRRLTYRDPSSRMDLEEALSVIQEIGSDEAYIKAIYEQYVFKAKEIIMKDPTALNLSVDILEIRKKGIIELDLVENNPKQCKKQKLTKLTENLEKFFNQGEEKVFLLLGEAGSGKSLSLQLRFLEELENWKYGKKGDSGIPVFFNMAENDDLEEVFRHLNEIVGCNLKLNEENEKIHLFIDSYDEFGGEERLWKRRKDKFLDPTEVTQPSQNHSQIHDYIEKLKNWKQIKILISCRTEFVHSEGITNLNCFKFFESGRSTVPITMYIAPIGYSAELDEDKTSENLHFLVSQWLKRENFNAIIEEILIKIEKLGLKEKMKTGMMFNMIMNMILKTELSNFDDHQKMTRYEIYRRTIKEEFNQNWKLIVSADEEKEKEKIKCIEEEINKFLKNSSISLKTSDNNKEEKPTASEHIWAGMERIGEILASKMINNNKNHLSFSDLESLFNEDSKSFTLLTKIEWSTIYQMAKLMGWKIENFKIANTDIIQNEDLKRKTIEIGFRHETYKNYYMLRGLKRIFSSRLKSKTKAKETGLPNWENAFDIDYDEELLTAVLDNPETMINFEFLKFVGEEESKNRNSALVKGLQRIIKSVNRTSNRRATMSTGTKGIKKGYCSRTAVAISLLVAGKFSFSGRSLDNLDLSDAILRGGIFFRAKFNQSNLTRANMRNADLTEAVFSDSNVSYLETGVCPNMIGHKGAVNSISFSPDGNIIISASDDKLVKIWNTEKAESELSLQHNGKVTSACFSPDGKIIVTCGEDRNIILWDRFKGISIMAIQGHEKVINTVSFCPLGDNFATGSSDNMVKIWDLHNGKNVQTLDAHENSVFCLSFSNDGKLLASGSKDKTIKIWELMSGNCVNTLDEHESSVYSVCFSPKGSTIASGSSDYTIKIWNYMDCVCLQTLSGHIDSVCCICFSPDGNIIASGSDSDDRTIKLWSSTTGECLDTLLGHERGVKSICFNMDGRKIASGGEDGIAMMWDCSVGVSVQMLEGHYNSVHCVQFSRDGRSLASGCGDSSIKVWDSRSGVCLHTLEGHERRVLSLSFSPDGKTLISASLDQTVKVWDVTNGKCVQTLKGHSDCVTSVVFSPDGLIFASASDDFTVKVWESKGMQCLHTLQGHKGFVSSICFSPENQLLVSGSQDKTIILWESRSGQNKMTFIGHKNSVKSVCFGSSGQKILSGDEGGLIKIWDYKTGKCILNLEGHGEAINCVCFSPDENKIASCSLDTTVKIWDSFSGEVIDSLERHVGSVESVCFSMDGEKLILASAGEDNSIILWENMPSESFYLINPRMSSCLLTERRVRFVSKPSGSRLIDQWVLRMVLKAVEEPFQCRGAKFKNCFIDSKNNRDLLFEKVIQQRGGIYIPGKKQK